MVIRETCETSGKGATGGTSEMGKTRGGQSVHVAPLALVVPVALERLAAFFSILPGISVSNRAKEYA